MTVKRDPKTNAVIPNRRRKRGRKETDTDPRVSLPTVSPGEVIRHNAAGKRINEAAVCTARRVDGEPCRVYAIAGATVCRVHGGSAPQVIRNARVRLAMRQDWLLTKLLDVIELTDDEKLKVQAIFGAMDRGGLHAKSAVELEATVELKPFERSLQAAMVRVVKVQVDADGNETVVEGQAASVTRWGNPMGRGGILRDLPTDKDADRYSAVEAGTVDDVVDAVVVLDSDDGEPIEYRPPTRSPATYDADAPKVNSSDTPPTRVADRTPGYVRPGGERRSATTMRR